MLSPEPPAKRVRPKILHLPDRGNRRDVFATGNPVSRFRVWLLGSFIAVREGDFATSAAGFGRAFRVRLPPLWLVVLNGSSGSRVSAAPLFTFGLFLYLLLFALSGRTGVQGFRRSRF